MFSVYTLRSTKDHGLYFGQTKNVRERLFQHNAGRVRSTRNRRPLILIDVREFASRNEARYYEWRLKHSAHAREKHLNHIMGV